MNLSQKQVAVRFLELAAAGEVDEAYSSRTLSITTLTMLVMRLL